MTGSATFSFLLFFTAFSTNSGSLGEANALRNRGMKCLSSSTWSADFTSVLFPPFRTGSGGGDRALEGKSDTGGGGERVLDGSSDTGGGGERVLEGNSERGGGGGEIVLALGSVEFDGGGGETVLALGSVEFDGGGGGVVCVLGTGGGDRERRAGDEM